MKKLLAVAAMTIAATSASSVMADNGLFVGAEFGKAKTKTESFGIEETSKLNQYGLRAVYGTKIRKARKTKGYELTPM